MRVAGWWVERGHRGCADGRWLRERGHGFADGAVNRFAAPATAAHRPAPQLSEASTNSHQCRSHHHLPRRIELAAQQDHVPYRRQTHRQSGWMPGGRRRVSSRSRTQMRVTATARLASADASGPPIGALGVDLRGPTASRRSRCRRLPGVWTWLRTCQALRYTRLGRRHRVEPSAPGVSLVRAWRRERP